MTPGNIHIIDIILKQGYPVWIRSFSALDSYLGMTSLPFVFLETEADIGGLARLFEDFRFPGADLADGAVDADGKSWYFRCRESWEAPLLSSYRILSLVQDLKNGHFIDPLEIYPQIRFLKNSLHKNSAEKKPAGDPAAISIDQIAPMDWWEGLLQGTDSIQAVMDGALIMARYEALPVPVPGFFESLNRIISNGSMPGQEAQQVLLTGILFSSRPDRGLEFLKASGFMEKYWPELTALNRVDHSKEFHPEGNAWKHTLQTFEYRKPNSSGEYDLRLSLGLLLHDIGKPLAAVSGNHRFEGHAELGAQAGKRFLERLRFDPVLAEDVFFLVKNHMLPAALARLPLTKTAEIMDSPLFHTLMELYRCDESSSFKGLEAYYENSAAYQNYLRNTKNPYRFADGTLLNRKRKRKYHME